MLLPPYIQRRPFCEHPVHPADSGPWQPDGGGCQPAGEWRRVPCQFSPEPDELEGHFHSNLWQLMRVNTVGNDLTVGIATGYQGLSITTILVLVRQGGHGLPTLRRTQLSK